MRVIQKTTIEVTIENKGSEMSLAHQLGDLRVASRSSSRDRDNVLVADSLVILVKHVLRRMLLETKCRIEKKE